MPSTIQKDIIECWMETGRLMRKRMIDCAYKKKVNPSQIYALVIVQENPKLTMKQFADYMMISSPSATSLVNRLVRMNWVVRLPDSSNRKVVRIDLTKEGKQTLLMSMKEHMQQMKSILDLLDQTDQVDFARILRNLRDALAREAS